MTIDETISKLMEETKNRNKYAEKHTVTHEFLHNIDCMEQLAEWLKELKLLREEKSEFQIIASDNYKIGYNNAIDDFAKSIIDTVNDFPTVENEDGEIRPMRIEEMCKNISKKLKEGGNNE